MLKKTSTKIVPIWTIVLLTALLNVQAITTTPVLAQENSPSLQKAADLVAGDYEIYLQGQYFVLVFEGNEKGITMLSPVLGNQDLTVDDVANLVFSFVDHDGVNTLEFVRTEKGEVSGFYLSWGEDERHLAVRITEDRVFRDSFTKAEMMEDFGQLYGFMQMHPQLYEYTSEEEFQKLGKAAQGQIHDGMTAAEFYKVTAPLVAAIGCYHTRAYAPAHHWQGVDEGLLPLHLEIVGDDFYVRADYSDQHKLKPGSKILSIDGQPINEIAHKLVQYVSSDGFNPANREAYLEGGFSRYYQLVYGAQAQFEIEYIPYGSGHKSDHKKRAQVKACSSAHLIAKMHPEQEVLGLKIIPDENLAILRMDHFGFYQNKAEFNDFVDESFAAIAQQKIGNLIIDTRGNGGGDPYATRYLLSYLAREPFVYFHDPHESMGDTGKPMPLAEKNHFSGKVYTMLDGGEGSTTGHLIALLKFHDLCEFVGTESGATYFCNDGSVRFTMKNSRMRLKMARASFHVEVTGMVKDRGIMPDHPVQPTAQDLAENRDTTLEYTRSLIAGAK